MKAHPLFGLLAALDAAPIRYTLARDRPDTIRIDLALVGERVEIDVFEDGHMEVSRFVGSEAIVGDAALVDEIIASNSRE